MPDSSETKLTVWWIPNPPQEAFAFQYNTPCALLKKGDTVNAQDLIEFCRNIGAVYYEDGPDDECFVVDVDRGVGPEIYTESALRGSFPAARTQEQDR